MNQHDALVEIVKEYHFTMAYLAAIYDKPDDNSDGGPYSNGVNDGRRRAAMVARNSMDRVKHIVEQVRECLI